MFGDDCGLIHILYFKSPVTSLFDPLRRKVDPSKTDKATSNSVQRIFWDVSSYIFNERSNSKSLYFLLKIGIKRT